MIDSTLKWSLDNDELLTLDTCALTICSSTLAQSCSCFVPSLAFATRTTSKHQRITCPGLYGKLIECLRILGWHMRVSAHFLEVTWLECVCSPYSNPWTMSIQPDFVADPFKFIESVSHLAFFYHSFPFLY